MLTGNGLTQTVYNKDNKPTTLVKNGTTSTFKYGADGMRYKQTKTTGNTTTVTYYVGKGFEREVQPGNHIVDKTYIGNHTTLYKTVAGTPQYTASVVHNLVDRLGSPSTLIKGSTSSPIVIRHRAHGIFGRPIDAGTGSIMASLSSWDGNYRGYTGHEQLVEQELVHMNGRIYDYNLGRFMSVDPFIQMPESSQSINPYSYIMNNPMAGTDPTGYLAQGTNASNWRDTCLDPHGCLSTPAERALSAYTSSGGSNNSLSLNAQKGLDEMNKGFAAVEQAWNVFANTFGQVDIVDLPAGVGTTGDGKSPQQKTTDDGFRKNNNLNVNINDGVISIKGTVYSKLDYDAELFIAYLTKEFSGNFNVDGEKYTFDIDLKHVMRDEQGDVKLIAIRGLPPKDGSLIYRSNAQHGGREINLSMYERNVQKDAAHEFMHILGFGDTYRDTANGSESFSGHENDIMGSSSGKIQNYHIRTLLGNYED